MRFLHSIPLPLLLILSSFVSFDLQAVPFDSNQQPRRLIRSANDIGPNNLSYVFENYDKLAEQYRRKNSAVTVKPLSLENEGSSEPAVTDDYNELSADELMTKWELEEQNLRQLNETIDAENEKLEQKMKDAAVIFEDYDKAKAEWQRLDGVFNEKNKGKLELEYIKGNATEKYDKAKKAYEDMDKTVKEQEKIEAKLEEAKKGADDVEHFATYLPQEKAKAKALSETEIPNQQKLVAGLVDPITTATGARNLAKTEFEGLKMLDSRCKTSTDQTNCPTIENINTANQTLRDREGELFTATENHRRESEKLVELQKEEGLVNARVELLKKYESRTETFRDLFAGDVQEYEKKQKEFGKSLDETRVLNASLYDAYAIATEIKTGAENDLNNYPTNDIDAAQNEASMTFSVFLNKERIRNPLHDELDKMKKHLQELEKERDQSNQLVHTLKQVYEKKSKKEEPKKGSAVTIVLIVIGVVMAFCLFGIFWKIVVTWPRIKLAMCRQRKTVREPSAAKVDSHASDASKTSQQQPQPDPALDPRDSATKSNEAQPSPAPTDAAPVTDGEKYKRPFVENLDKFKMKFEDFVKRVPDEKNRDMLRSLVQKGSLVYRKNNTHIFNLDVPGGVVYTLHNMTYLKYGHDARNFKTHVVDFKKPTACSINFPINPNENGDFHWAVDQDMFAFVTETHRKTLKEVIADKHVTKANLLKWSRVVRSQDPNWGKEGRVPEKKRSAAGQDEEEEVPCSVDDMKKKILEMGEDEVIDMYCRVVEKEKSEALKDLFRQELENHPANAKPPGRFAQLTRAVNERVTQMGSILGPFFKWMNVGGAKPLLTREVTDAVRGSCPIRSAQLGLEETQSGEGEVDSNELPGLEEISERSSSGGSDRDKSNSDKKTDGSDKKTDGSDKKSGKKRKSRRQKRNAKKKKRSRGKKPSKDGKRGRNKRRKDDSDSSSSTESDPRSPRKDAIKIAEKAQDKRGEAYIVHDDRVIMEDASKPPDEDELLKYPDGSPRKRLTGEAVDKELAKHDPAMESTQETQYDAENVLDIFFTFLDTIKNDQKYLIVEDEKPNVTVGDLHGNKDTVYNIFALFGGVGSQEWLDHTYDFTGDLVDRGKRSISLLLYLFLLKIKYPKNIILLRGNHECYETNVNYGFLLECLDGFKDKEGTPKGTTGRKVHYFANHVFSYMSIACLHNGVWKAHGGLARNMPENLEDLNKIMPKFMWEPRRSCYMAYELLWNDPVAGIKGFAYGEVRGNWTFGEDVVEEFLRDHHEVKLVVRAHQVMNNGAEFFAGKKGLCVFTTTNYDKTLYPNHGAILVHTPDHVGSIVYLVGKEYQSAKDSKPELDKATDERTREEHNLNLIKPSLKMVDVKVAEADCPSETVKGY